MASLGEVASRSSKPRCAELTRRDIDTTTSEMWHGSSYCTPQSAPLTRSAANRRLDCSLELPPTALQLFHTSAAAAISTEPTSLSVSGEVRSVTLTSVEVSEGRKDVVTSLPFNDEQVDCICEVLRRSKDIERLQCFVRRLTPHQLHRNSEPLCKVHARHVPATCLRVLFLATLCN